MSKRIAGSFYSEKETLDVIENLKRQGYRETDIMVVAKKRSEIPLVAAQTGVMIEAEPQVNTLTGVMMDSFFTMMTGKRAEIAENGLADTLIARGIPDFTAKRCEAEAAEGKILVLVDTDMTYDNLNEIEAQYGTAEEKALRLREERLGIVKERVQLGELQVWKEVIEKEQTIQVPLTREEVYVERRPVIDGQYDGVSIGDNEVVRIPIMEERIEVTKKPVVVEEIIIGKRKVQEMKEVQDIVRKEEARIERSTLPAMEVNDGLIEAESTADAASLSMEDTQHLASVTDGQKEEKRAKRTGSLSAQEKQDKQAEKTKKEEATVNNTEFSNDKQNKKNAVTSQKKEEASRSEDSSTGEENKNDRTQINKVKK